MKGVFFLLIATIFTLLTSGFGRSFPLQRGFGADGKVFKSSKRSTRIREGTTSFRQRKSYSQYIPGEEPRVPSHQRPVTFATSFPSPRPATFATSLPSPHPRWTSIPFPGPRPTRTPCPCKCTTLHKAIAENIFSYPVCRIMPNKCSDHHSICCC